MKAYIVQGHCGQHDSYYNWNVCVCLCGEKAKDIADKAYAFKIDNRKKYTYEEIRDGNIRNPYDPNNEYWDDKDVSYSWGEIECIEG